MKMTSKSIAVLPFVNMSSDADNEYFSDGITEEIINALTKVQGLKVIARTSSFSFKGKNIDVREIGKKLGVSTVLEGSVRKEFNRVRITSQLISADDGIHIWSESFDKELEDIFAVQDEISILIANKIRDNFGHLEIEDHLVKESTKDVTAYDFFLKGRFHQLKWKPESIKKAIEFYDKAIECDSQYAKAYYGNLQCYGLLAAWGYMDQEEGFQKAILNFQKAKEIDTNLPEYYQSFVGKAFWGEWNFKAAFDYIQKALEMDQHYSDALEAMTELFIANGYFDAAEKFINKALDTDPLSANHNYTLAHINYLQKKYSKAISLIDGVLQINNDLSLAAELKAVCLLRLKNKTEFDEYIKDLSRPDLLKLLYDVINNKFKLDNSVLDELKNASENKNQLVPYELYILANSDYKEEALLLLEKYIEMKRGQIINYKFEPLLEPLHNLHGFNELHISNLDKNEIEIKDKSEKSSKIDNEEIENLAEKIISYLKEKKSFLNPQLSLSGLATDIDIHPNKLSFVINEKTGNNFNEFINGFRLKHFKSIANDPEFKNITILGLAYESGFNSKSVFNSYFKKNVGKTPKAWLDSVRG
ncbi:MAG: helix-turn-helix domain-containing protein [Ignavibacteriales bacterium]|nr:helix-turn-helix domain-containing protein [Ignavibacteriales bacterium]MCB9220003.1 helix-turn-helix domain-containing protein [Ignavibacteriales bacterium]